MEEFLLAHSSRHESLVKRFKPPRPTASGATDTINATSGAGTVIATRIRPMLDEEVSSGQVVAAFPRIGDRGVVDLHELRRVPRGPPPLNSSSFKVGKVFGPDQTTEAIYGEIVQPLLPWVLQGNVGTLFAYGQTGSGKTYTVNGLERMIADSLVNGARERQQTLHLCMFELAGNSAYDLLNSRAPFSILEDSFGDTQLAGIKEHQIDSVEVLLQLIEEATSFRKTAATVKNDNSSRSHAICRLRIAHPPTTPLEDGILYLIDLAGSESARDMAPQDSDRQKESREINISLSVLKDCIRGVASMNPTGKASAKKTYIPFRQSMLTKVLKHVFDSFGNRHCQTAVIACINPSFLDTGASKNTLRYAEMLQSAQLVRKPLPYDPTNPKTWTNQDLQKWIRDNSGYPAISASTLAPHESGAQLLRIPSDVFIRRSLQTEGVSHEQAERFRQKFWDLHINSRNGVPKAKKGVECCQQPEMQPTEFSSNENEGSTGGKEHFKERISPGMTVYWTSPADSPVLSKGKSLAVVLCPHYAVEKHASDFLGSKNRRYLCAIVYPGSEEGTYHVNLRDHVLVDVEHMNAEVMLNYNPDTRYYYISSDIGKGE